MKKLTLIAFAVFLLIGGFALPHSIKASSINDSCSATPAGNNLLCVVPKQTTLAIDEFEITEPRGLVGDGMDVAAVLSRTKSYTQTWKDIGKKTGKKTIDSITQEEKDAYFADPANRTDGGINGILATLNTTLLDQRPGSGVDYVNQKVYAITNPGKVYAADNPSTYYPGPGSELLRPIQGFWGWSVNLVFGFLVLLILVIALAIMFRQRLGGAAEVTIQNAIPSIALAMILIPLSYAISGLFIDAITLGTNAVHGFLLGPQSPGSGVYNNRPNADDPECDLQNLDLGADVRCDRGYYADDPMIDVWRSRDRIDIRDAGSQIGEGVGVAIQGNVPAEAVFNIIGGILKLLPGDEDTFSDYAWFGNLINIIIGILTIWISLKIFKRLISKYLTLILMPAFSPFIFATAALPGNGTKSIIMYLKTLGSASLFYIVTYAMFLLTLIFTSSAFQDTLPDFRTAGYIPPLLGLQKILTELTSTANAFPLTQLVMTGLGLGIFFSIPKTLDNIDEAMGTKFVMPQLLKTPWESIRESANVAARATQVTFRRAAELNQTRRTAIPGINRFARNQYDKRVRGLEPGKAGTWQAQQSSRLGNTAAAIKSRIAAEERILAADPNDRDAQARLRQANRELRNVQGEAERMGVPIGRGDTEKGVSLSAKLTWKTTGADNIYTFTRSQIDSFLGDTSPFTLPAELTLEVSNLEFNPGQEINYGGPKEISNTGDVEYGDLTAYDPTPGVDDSHMKFGEVDSAPNIISRGKRIFGNFYINQMLSKANKIPDTLVTLQATDGPAYNPVGKNKLQAKFLLTISNPNDLFYGTTGNTDPLKGTFINPNKQIISLKRMFQITLRDGTVLETEKPLSIIIKGTYE